MRRVERLAQAPVACLPHARSFACDSSLIAQRTIGMKGDGPRDAVLKEVETSIRQGLRGLDARESAGRRQCGMSGCYSAIQFRRIGG